MTQLNDAELSPMHLDDVPAGYPRALEEWVTLAGGSRIFVRPIAPVDRARMAHALEFGDTETIQRRFLTGAPPKGQGAVRYLITPDYEWRHALIAMDSEGNSIGVGRYEGSEGQESAEIAIVVDPQWRGLGVGSVLLGHLEPHASEAGIEQFVALYQPDNVGVAALLKSLGYEPAPMADGLVSVTKSLR
jgi:GNAT superfamily N-acetyltransferase